MNLSEIIIVMLIAEISMVFWIFRWAYRAMGRFRAQIIDLLSGESEESSAIMEKLGHTIYQKLYRYFNLNLPKESPMSASFGPINDEPNSLSPLAQLATKAGIGDQEFIGALTKYGPMLQKLLSKQTINTSEEIGSKVW